MIAHSQLKEKHFQTLVEKTSEGLLLLNERFQIIYINPAVELISGFRLEDLQNFKSIDFIDPLHLTYVRDLIKRSYENPGRSFKAQVRIFNKNRQHVWLEGIITNLIDDEEVRAFVLNFRDVSERKEAERLINELNEGLE